MIKYTDIIACESVLKFSEINEKISGDGYNVTTDSRAIRGRNCFIALHGEKFNANTFIKDLAEDVNLVIFCKKNNDDEGFDALVKKFPKNTFVEVTDTYKYILELGRLISSRWQSAGGQMIAVTGSNGKTTNKEMLYALFSEVFPGLVHKTRGNLNNHIGVPLTLFELSESDKVCVAEMGMNHAGELAPLAKAIAPTAGLITSIGPAHLEFLGSIENIFKEKKVLFDWIDNSDSSSKTFVLRENDNFLKILPERTWCKRLSKSDYELIKNGFKVLIDDRWHEVQNENLLGDHNKENMIQSLFLATDLYPEHYEKFLIAASNFQMPKMNRGDFFINEKVTIYLDAYNANPGSMKSSLNAFFEHCEASTVTMDKRLFILGDMNELGDESAAMHSEIGQFLKLNKAENALFIGQYSKNYAAGFGDGAQQCEDVDKLKKYLRNKQDNYSAIFIKGSRSLQLESLIDINGRLNLN